VIVTADAWINDFVFMNTNATVGHDSVIHAWTTMFPNTEVCGDCVIGVSVIMGIGSYVLPGKEIANRVKISAGSIVRHHFKGPVHEGVVLQGNPAAPR
jgi:carbonic anhydrase/acetyltransferase-like protein (isoleucine patch superfamily)